MRADVEKELDKLAPLLPRTEQELRKLAQGKPLLGIACVAVSALCFSLMSTFIKYMTFTFSSMEAILWRSTGAFVCNSIAVMVSGRSLFVAPEKRCMLALRCLAGFVSIGFAFYAMSQMVLADASVIVFTSPVMTFFFVREPVVRCCWVCRRLIDVSMPRARSSYTRRSTASALRVRSLRSAG